MTQDPTLIIQLQRMGDLILSFLLVEKLLLLEPERPIWIVAEPYFFNGLLSVAPPVVFFDLSMSSELQQKKFKRIINVSHRDVAINFASSLNAEEYIGVFRQGNSLTIKGSWRLYRSSIVENNRHNLFHWSDLEALGIIPAAIINQINYPVIQEIRKTGQIGLFVGASEDIKRPDAQFWGVLAHCLSKRGLSPIFLGGPNDVALATQASKIAGIHSATNFAGKFSLSELIGFLPTLDLLISPDTGPMHVASRVKVPVINLSMANVNPWETAAASPGHIVVRAAMSCVGCWHCEGRNFLCRKAFTPEKIVNLVTSIIEKKILEASTFSGLRLYNTARDERGLFTLTPLIQYPEVYRYVLGSFWQEWFISMLGGVPNNLFSSLEILLEQLPQLCFPIKKGLQRITKECTKSIRDNKMVLSSEFWSNIHPVLRPLSGYLDLLLQNGNYHRNEWDKVMYMVTSLTKMFSCS